MMKHKHSSTKRKGIIFIFNGTIILMTVLMSFLLNSCRTSPVESPKPKLDIPAIPSANIKSKSDLIEIDGSLKNSLAAENSREMQILKNADFATMDIWKLRNCAWEKIDDENLITFNSPNNEFKKFFQRINFAPKPGTKIILSAEVKTMPFDKGTPYPSNPVWFKPTLYMNFFADDKKTKVYVQKEKGKGCFIDDTNGKFVKKTITYTVPRNTEMMSVAFKCSPPVQAYVKNVSLTMPVTKEQAKDLGLNWKEKKSVIKSTEPVLERAKKWTSDNEIIAAVHPVTISVDGKDDDWVSIPFAGKIDQAVPKFTAPSSPEDCEGSFKVAVDDNFLYLLIKIRDDKLVFGKNKNYNDDSIEVCVSPEFNQGEKYGEMDFQISFSPKNIDSEEFYFAGMNYQKYFMPTVKRVPVENGWGVEMAIPLNNELFVAPVYDMKAIGLNIAYNDNDSETLEHKLSWSKFETQGTGWKDPNVFGALVVLSDKNKDAALVRASDAVKFRKGERYDFVNRKPGIFNIIHNSSFENGLSNWMEWYGRSGYNFELDDTVAKTGKKSMKIDGTKYQNEAMALFVSQYFDVIPGEKYQLELALKTDSPNNIFFIPRAKAPNYKHTMMGGAKLSAGDGWVSEKFTFTIPEKTVENNALDLLLAFKGLNGYNAWVDDVQLKRFVPASFDAELEFPSHDQTFIKDSKQNLKLNLQSSQNEKLDVKIDFVDAFKAKPISSFKKEIDLNKNVGKTIDIPLLTDKNGYIRVKCVISDKKGDFIVRQSDYAVRDKLTGRTKLADMCIGHHIYFDDSAEKLVKAAKEIGTGSIRVFIDRTQEYADGKYNFKNMEPLVNAAQKNNIEFIACVKTFDRGGKLPCYDIESWEKYLRALVKKFKGRVNVWGIGGETNLTTAWLPKPDPREYETVLRCAYNVVKEEDPQAKVATAGFNQAKLDPYFKTFLDMDKGNFYDIFAFHPYDYLKASAFNESFPEFMKAVKENHPVGEAIDTESGFDHETYQWAVELSSKKIPYFLFTGVDAHYEWGFDKSASGYLYAPFASTSPQQAVYTVLNNLYADAEPLGELKTGDFIGYINKNPKDTFLVLWRSGYDKSKTVDIPVDTAYKVMDIFGNDITRGVPMKNGTINIQLKDRQPIYIFGVKTAGLKGKITAPPKYEIGKRHVAYVKDVLLLPEELKGFFDITVPKEITSTKKLKLKNYSAKTVEVDLTTNSSIAEFTPAKVKLPPKATKAVKLLINGDMEGVFNVSLAGKIVGEVLAPLPVVIEVSDALAVSTKGRFVVLTNNSEKPVKGQISFRSPLFNILPFNVKNINIEAGKKFNIPVKLTPRKNKHGYIVYPRNGLAEIFAQFSEAKGKDVKSRINLSLAKAIPISGYNFNDAKLFEKLQSSQKSMLELKSTENGEMTKMSAFFAYDMQNLYIIARVEDSSGNQTNTGGYIGEGDALIVGIDSNSNTKDSEYQVDDFEAGFALKNDNGIEKYRWNGKFGLESAKPFTDAKVRITRSGKIIDYTLKIPVSAELMNGKTIGLSLKLINLTESGKKTVLRFGSGLDKARDASAFGILNLK